MSKVNHNAEESVIRNRGTERYKKRYMVQREPGGYEVEKGYLDLECPLPLSLTAVGCRVPCRPLVASESSAAPLSPLRLLRLVASLSPLSSSLSKLSLIPLIEALCGLKSLIAGFESEGWRALRD
jgi:hypothetical protein